MPTTIRIVAGPALSGKTTALVQQYRRALQRQTTSNEIGSALWIAPNQRAAETIRLQLLKAGALRGCFSPGICTFGQFADTILAQAHEPYAPVGGLLKRQLIERLLVDENIAGRLQHFGPIAQTAGLVDLVAEFISDLKRQTISPQEFSRLAERVEPSEKNRELGAIYAAYQRLLTDRKLYDGEERFTLARDRLRSGPVQSLANLRLAVVDGFTDFTQAQHDILLLLAEQAKQLEELVISLPLEQETGREDLFTKSKQTLEQFRTSRRDLQIQWQARPAESTWTAMARLERHLFCNPRMIAEAASNGKTALRGPIEIIAASGQLAEIESVARRIKNLLVRGDASDGNRTVRPNEIVVVFRSIDSSGALVQEVFDEYGVPVAVENRATLGQSPLLQALVVLLRVAAENWPYRPLLALLSNNYFRPTWSEWQQAGAAVAADWAIRQLQVPRGWDELKTALQWGAKLPEPAEGTDEQESGDLDIARQREHRQRYGAALKLLTRLDKVLSKLNKPRKLSQWIGAIEEAASACGVWIRSANEADDRAWDALISAIKASEQFEQRLKLEARTLSAKDFIAWLNDAFSTEPLPAENDEVGRVRVLSAQSVRALSVPYLFAAGLSEKSFPAPLREDRIFSEVECRELNEAGLKFADNRLHGSEEMLLFYEVVTRATRQLVLSYPALDEKAQPLLASPYLTELIRIGPEYVRQANEVSLSPVPRDGQIYNATEQRVRAVDDLKAGKPERLAQLLRGSNRNAGGNIVAGLTAIAARSERSFSPFEGILPGDATRDWLAKHFGPEHCWSVSRLEEYASCPYRFFSNSMLKLEPLPELALATDYGKRGSLAHEALKGLHNRLNTGATTQSPSAQSVETFETFSDDTLAVLFERIPKKSLLEQALRKADFELLAKWMKKYFGQHQKYDASHEELGNAFQSAHFEVSFGLKASGKGTDLLSTEAPFALQCGDETVRFSGRIDRIDIALVGDQVIYNIVDYKTGAKKKLTAEDLEAGLALQLPIYALAVQELLMIDRRAKPWRVGYWYLKDRGFENEQLPQMFANGKEGWEETDAWRELKETLLARVVALVRSVRGGMFPVFSLDDKCTSRCPYQTVCRIGQVRSIDKQWSPPKTAALAEVPQICSAGGTSS